MIYVKEGVDLSKLSPQMALGASIVHAAYDRYRCAVTITSGADGQHKEGSLHYTGKALDFRTEDIEIEKRAPVFALVRMALGDQFDVIIEPNHLHVEYDPKAGVSTWPT